METQKKSNTMSQKTKKKKSRKKTPAYSALEKCQAVLSIWSERRKPVDVCREMSVNWTVLSQWQNRAMEGMLQALEVRKNLDQGPALSPKLQAMLEKHRSRDQKKELKANAQRLGERLSRIQEEQKTAG